MLNVAFGVRSREKNRNKVSIGSKNSEKNRIKVAIGSKNSEESRSRRFLSSKSMKIESYTNSRIRVKSLEERKTVFGSRCLSVCLFLWAVSILLQKSEASWWFVSQTSNLSNPSSSKVICNNIPGLVRRQRVLCERNTDLMLAVAEGASLGIKECQFQFRNAKWNCSIFPRDSSVYGRQVLRSTREASFVHAVNSAAVVYAVTRACNEGQLEHCECDPTKKGHFRDKRGQFTWGGCSDNIRFSSSFARRFIDSSEKRQRDVKSKVTLHNNRVGRKSIRKQTKLQCKCHGVSGSCTHRTCWLSMSRFRLASEWLKHRYEKAVEVIAKPDGSGLLPRYKRKLRKIDLVYLERSPDYCQTLPEKGLLGTKGRECNVSSDGSDGCSTLCCGRGFYPQKKLVTSQCGCSFKWCCYVSCNTCRTWKTFHFCNN